MMKKTMLLSLSLLTSTMLSAFESELGTFGYGRIQTTLDHDKATTCFGAPGASSKYRLGNECETWIELGLTQDVVFENGLKMHNQVRPIFYNPNNESIDFFDWGEIYTELSNFSSNSAKVWIGRKFYQRLETHMSDYWPLNMSGTGFGVEDVDLEEIVLSYAFVYEYLNPTIDTGDKDTLFGSHDLRLMKKHDRGEVTWFANYMHLSSKEFDATNSVEAQSGFATALFYKDNEIFKELWGMKGDSVSGVFYGKGLAKDGGEYVPYMRKQFGREALIDNLINSGTSIDDAYSLRLQNFNTFENDTLGFMTNLLYEYKDESDFSGVKQNWFSAGVRPYWFIHANARLVGEVGYDRVGNQKDDETYHLFKSTVATEFALNRGVWERPVVRLYYTHAKWNDAAKGKIGGEIYANDTAGDNIGIQLETWW